MIRFIRKVERKRRKRHPVGMTFQYKGGTNKALFESPADWISPGPQGHYRDDPPLATGRKVILSDTDHLWGLGGSAHWVWMTFLRGMNPIYMDDLDERGSAFPDAARDKEAIRRAMGHTRRYAQKLTLEKMTPQKRLASTRFCLADPGAEYLIYQPEAGPFAVSLPRCRQAYAVEWFNTRTGKLRHMKPVTAGGRTTFLPPFTAPAVLHLRAVGA